MRKIKLAIGLLIAWALLPWANAQDNSRQVVEALSARSKSD